MRDAPHPESTSSRSRRRVETGGNLPYQVRATDTSGTITLRRDTPAAALKKAGELIGDGSWDVQIVTPDGHVYETDGFDALRVDAEVQTH
jgi:hypothetical protein